MSDRLETLLRELDPATIRREDPLSERALRELAEYERLEEDMVPLPGAAHARRRWPRLAASAAATLVLVASMVMYTNAQLSPAVALTPPMLTIEQPTDDEFRVAEAPAVLAELAARATITREQELEKIRSAETSGAELETVQAEIRAQVWQLDADPTGDATSPEPRWTETTFERDGTVRRRVEAAEPFAGQDASGLPTPGTVLADDTFPPGAWDAEALDGFPRDSYRVEEFLAELAGVEEELTASEALGALEEALSTYVVEPKHEIAILQYLSRRSDLVYEGVATDRLGYRGHVFRAPAEPGEEVERLLLVSASGTIRSIETIYVGDSRTDIDSPAVIAYTAWKRDS